MSIRHLYTRDNVIPYSNQIVPCGILLTGHLPSTRILDQQGITTSPGLIFSRINSGVVCGEARTKGPVTTYVPAREAKCLTPRPQEGLEEKSRGTPAKAVAHPPAPPQDEYAESQNVRALDPGPSRKGKEKAATSRDVEAEKAKEVRELAETRSQFQHVIKYLCDNLSIPPPPPRNLASRLGSQLRSNPAHVEPSTPSQQGARSQLEGLVHGDLRYSLMARRQGEGNDPEPPYVECLRKQLLTMQEEMRELRSSKGEPSSPDILGDFTAPLAGSVKNATLPGRFKMPQLDSYHGQSDPVAHVGKERRPKISSDKGKDKKKQDVRPSRPVPPQQGSVPRQQDSQRAPLPYRRPPQPRPETLRPQPPPQPREVPHPPRRESATTHAYHPLNTTREQVFYAIRDKGLLTRPPKLITPLGKRNLKRYCDFHEEYGHSTADCFNLREQIQNLINNGYLKEFLLEVRGKAQAVRQAGESSGGDQGQPGSQVTKDKDFISTISGGPTLAGDSRRARKAHAREPSLALTPPRSELHRKIA
ncbi:Retrotransposon gag domain-containing protein [Melia azedarach]|uniref:Retrotransposon gag domain-containing protein n=1 Tax=Melia azedarach TaxID=155640 RepID=A0ACC1XUT2_MELAZ|nr:Retrotransposon gag domain-containing protein [Melia azedarach]